MRAILDSCLALKTVLPEVDTPKAVRLSNEFRLRLHDLLATDVFPVEAAHALAKAERRGIITRPLGARRLAAVLRNVPYLHPYLPLLPRAYAIASHAGIGAYDCLYVALAEREGCDLITADVRLLNSLKPAFPFLIDLASQP
jgi:predicted nucleic acid-binding protein